MSADVVVVGGGPVGLWTAIQTKILTGKEVVVAEKYPEYQRSDIRLNISAASLKGIPQCPPLEQLTKDWANRAVPIKAMEDALVQCAHQVGVKILCGQTIDPKQLREQFPSAKVFIGADGARSSMREELFGNNYKFNTPLQYLVQVQYKIKSRDEPEGNSLRTSLDSYKKLTFAGHLITENIRTQDNGESLATLRIFIDEKTYLQMADAKFSNPYYFETDLNKVPDKLKNTLMKWWGYQENLEIIQTPKTNKITVIPLAAYATKKVIKTTSDGIVYALVGDAAQAYPFFRAVNNGLLLGTKLAQCTAKAFENSQSKRFTASFSSYSRYATFRCYVEAIKAHVKNIFITLSRFWIKATSTSPLQTIKLPPKEKAKCVKRGEEIWKRLTQATPPLATSS